MSPHLEAKIDEMLSGGRVVLSDSECDSMVPYQVSNYLRTIANSNQVGNLDRWEGWLSSTINLDAKLKSLTAREFALVEQWTLP